MESATNGNPTSNTKEILRKIFLYCGIASALLYAAMNVFIAMQWKEYNSASQTVSELSAINAPTRQLWLPPAFLYTALTIAFGLGVWMSARGKQLLKVAGSLLVLYGLSNIAWPFFPMHLREDLAAGQGNWSDTGHLVLAGVTVAIYIAALSFAAASFGKTFMWYSITTLVVLAVFGLLTALDAPLVEKNMPTPYTGVWERINIGVFLLWIVVLSVQLIRPDVYRTESKTRAALFI